MSTADSVQPESRQNESNNAPSPDISPEPIFIELSQNIALWVSSGNAIKTHLATRHSACAQAILKLQTHTNFIPTTPKNAELFKNARRTMRQYTQILAKINAITEDLDPVLDKFATYQRQLADQFEFWDKLRSSHDAQSMARLDSEEDVRKADAIVALNEDAKDGLKGLKDIILGIKWEEIDVTALDEKVNKDDGGADG